MTNQVGKFQPPVPGNLKDRIVKPGCQLLDACRLTAACGAEDVQRFLWVEKPDHNIAAGLMENIVVVNGRGIGRGSSVALDQRAGRFAAKDLTGIEVGSFQVTKNLSINNFPISLPESDEGSSQMRESQVS